MKVKVFSYVALALLLIFAGFSIWLYIGINSYNPNVHRKPYTDIISVLENNINSFPVRDIKLRAPGDCPEGYTPSILGNFAGLNAGCECPSNNGPTVTLGACTDAQKSAQCTTTNAIKSDNIYTWTSRKLLCIKRATEITYLATPESQCNANQKKCSPLTCVSSDASLPCPLLNYKIVKSNEPLEAGWEEIETVEASIVDSAGNTLKTIGLRGNDKSTTGAFIQNVTVALNGFNCLNPNTNAARPNNYKYPLEINPGTGCDSYGIDNNYKPIAQSPEIALYEQNFVAQSIPQTFRTGIANQIYNLAGRTLIATKNAKECQGYAPSTRTRSAQDNLLNFLAYFQGFGLAVIIILSLALLLAIVLLAKNKGSAAKAIAFALGGLILIAGALWVIQFFCLRPYLNDAANDGAYLINGCVVDAQYNQVLQAANGNITATKTGYSTELTVMLVVGLFMLVASLVCLALLAVTKEKDGLEYHDQELNEYQPNDNYNYNNAGKETYLDDDYNRGGTTYAARNEQSYPAEFYNAPSSNPAGNTYIPEPAGPNDNVFLQDNRYHGGAANNYEY